MVRIPRGIHTGNWNVLCVLLHFSSCVKPPCSFVMRLPNLLDCSMEVLFAKAFLPTPGLTRGFVKPEGNNKNRSARLAHCGCVKVIQKRSRSRSSYTAKRGRQLITNCRPQVWRRRRDSNPRGAINAYTISNRAPSTKLGDFSILIERPHEKALLPKCPSLWALDYYNECS